MFSTNDQSTSMQAGQRATVKQTLAPFNIALALSVARIHRFEEQVGIILRVTIESSNTCKVSCHSRL